MEERRAFIVYFVSMFLIFFLVIIMPSICCINMAGDNKIFLLIGILISFGVAYCIYKLLRIWLSYLLGEKCRIKECTYITEKLSKMWIYKNNVKMHMILLESYLVTGSYQKFEKKIEKLKSLESKLSEFQKIEIRIYELYYFNMTGNRGNLEKIEELEEALNKLQTADAGKDELQKILISQKYFVQEQWDEIIERLGTREGETVAEEVIKAYLLGLSYLKTGRDKEAFKELQFVIKNGGDMRYVSMAAKLLEDLPLLDVGEKKAKKKKAIGIHALKYAVLGILCAGLLIYMNCFIHKASGNSITEAYSRSYWVSEESVEIIYQQQIDQYEFAILSDRRHISYVLFEEREGDLEKIYRVSHSYRLSMKELKPKQPTEHIVESERRNGVDDFTLKAYAKNEVWNVINKFYKKEKVFYRDNFSCIGVSYYSNVEDIEVDNQLINIKDRKVINGENALIWEIQDVDLEKVNFFDLEIKIR